MFSMFKMYCYKMFRQKSLYVIWIIMLLFINIQTVSASFAQYSADFGAFYLIFASLFPVIFFSSDISSGFIIIICTVITSVVFALAFPLPPEKEEVEIDG